FDYRSLSEQTESWFRFLVEPIDGDHRGVVVMHVDITAFKLTQLELQCARERAELASRTKTEFLANMSHELRTPLNAIIGFSEGLREGYFGGLSTQQAEYIRDIHESGRHLLHVVNDILDLSKVEAGRLELTREAIDPKALIDSCLSLMRGKAQDAGLTLTLETQGNPRIFTVDKTRVRQIILNLLSNAIKFTPKGGDVAVRLTGIDASDVVVTIADTGIGMRADEISVALQPFRQIDNSLARRYEGTGLGLPLARLLTELHGGKFHIDSTPGIGTAVTVTLPVEA
ncbi:MAG: ATP-binding protein, partial [Dongiaceae bacterium]